MKSNFASWFQADEEPSFGGILNLKSSWVEDLVHVKALTHNVKVFWPSWVSLGNIYNYKCWDRMGLWGRNMSNGNKLHHPFPGVAASGPYSASSNWGPSSSSNGDSSIPSTWVQSGNVPHWYNEWPPFQWVSDKLAHFLAQTWHHMEHYWRNIPKQCNPASCSGIQPRRQCCQMARVPLGQQGPGAGWSGHIHADATLAVQGPHGSLTQGILHPHPLSGKADGDRIHSA